MPSSRAHPSVIDTLCRAGTPRLLAVPAIFLLALGTLVAFAPPARSADTFIPKADTYICPHSAGGAIDCYLEAVAHLYTMCRQVKSIEIIEFGYEKSTEGTNGAKSEYCVDKHKLSMVRPYQAALKEATPNATIVDGIRALQDLWLRSLLELKWNSGETDEQYKARVAKPYEAFKERADAVRAMIAAQKDNPPAPTADKGKKSKPATPPPKTKSAT